MRAWTLSLALALALSAAVVLAAPAAFAAGPDGAHALSLSAAKKKAVRRAPAHIACTVSGCHPTPPGCRPEMGRYWDGTPTGFDIVVCPRRR